MKRFLITWASDGIGQEIAKLAIKENIEIVCISRSKPNYDCIHIKTDLSDENSIKACVKEINENYSKFDAFLNCAWVFRVQSIEDITCEELE